MPDYLDDLARRGYLDSIEKPSPARVYDYLLGGKHNYAVDREFAKQIIAANPDTPLGAKSNRAFIGRAVRCAVEMGITQFVDVGSGLPGPGQPHDVADAVARAEGREPDSRVVYVDYEPIAHAHAEILLAREADPRRHHAVIADYNEPETLWNAVLAPGVIREDEPTCFLVTSMLHFQPPEKNPHESMEFYRSELAPGSLLVLTHASRSAHREANGVFDRYKQTTDSVVARTPEEIEAFFGDWELLDPGLVWMPEWRPDGTEQPWWGDDLVRTAAMGGIAVKPRGDGG
ncbi:MAG TPA: SAM-dependent methyltransferase [Amycolatopsis sp.]|nr:SAM-dependent methyltransferase [Amycolatopsis sp.]